MIKICKMLYSLLMLMIAITCISCHIEPERKMDTSPYPYDISPSHLNLSPADLEIRGDNLYAIDVLSGLSILSLENPKAPVLLINYPEIRGYQIDLSDDILVVADQEFITLYKLNSPVKLMKKSQQEIRGINNQIMDVKIYNSVVYLSIYSWAKRNRAPSIQIFRVNPDYSLIFQGILPLNQAYKTIIINDDILYLANRLERLNVFSLGNPEKPKFLKSYPFQQDNGLFFRDLGVATTLVHNNYFLAHIYYQQLYVYDVKNPKEISLIKIHELQHSISDAVIQDELMYCAGHRKNGLMIYDISNLPEISLLSRTDISSDYPISITNNNNHVYISCNYKGLIVVDVSEPEKPEKVYEYPSIGCVTAVYADNDYAYVVDSSKKLYIVDINPLKKAHIINSIELPFNVDNLVMINNYLVGNGNLIIKVDPPEDAEIIKFSHDPLKYRLSSNSQAHDYIYYIINENLCVYNYSSPRIAYRENEIKIGKPRELLIDGDYLYLVGNSIYLREDELLPGGLVIMHIREPSSPTVVGTLELPGNMSKAIKLDHELFLFSHQKVTRVDVSRPDSPRVIEEYDKSAYLRTITVDGDYIYMTETVGKSYLTDKNGFLEYLQTRQIRYPPSYFISWSWAPVEGMKLRYLTDEYIFTGSKFKRGLGVLKKFEKQ